MFGGNVLLLNSTFGFSTTELYNQSQVPNNVFIKGNQIVEFSSDGILTKI